MQHLNLWLIESANHQQVVSRWDHRTFKSQLMRLEIQWDRACIRLPIKQWVLYMLIGPPSACLMKLMFLMRQVQGHEQVKTKATMRCNQKTWASLASMQLSRASLMLKTNCAVLKYLARDPTLDSTHRRVRNARAHSRVTPSSKTLRLGTTSKAIWRTKLRGPPWPQQNTSKKHDPSSERHLTLRFHPLASSDENYE